jgi:hypothetical protein
MQWELERYKRQLGLVYQRRIMDLNVLLLGDGSTLPYLALNLASLGVGAGRGCIFLPAESKPVTSKQLEGQFFFKPEDEQSGISEAVARHIHELNPSVHVQMINKLDEYSYDAVLVAAGSEIPRLPPNKLVIWAGITNYGFYVGAQMPKVTSSFSRNILTPSLASVCAAIANQELLRVTRSVRASEIQRFWITLNYAFHRSTNASLAEKEVFLSIKTLLASPIQSIVFRLTLIVIMQKCYSKVSILLRIYLLLFFVPYSAFTTHLSYIIGFRIWRLSSIQLSFHR